MRVAPGWRGRREVVVEMVWVGDRWFEFRWWLSGVLYQWAFEVAKGHWLDESMWGRMRWRVAEGIQWAAIHIQGPVPPWYDREVEYEDEDIELDEWFQYVQAEFPPVRAEDLR